MEVRNVSTVVMNTMIVVGYYYNSIIEMFSNVVIYIYVVHLVIDIGFDDYFTSVKTLYFRL